MMLIIALVPTIAVNIEDKLSLIHISEPTRPERIGDGVGGV